MVLDMDVCQQYGDSSADHRIRKAVSKEASGTDQFYLWIQNKDVDDQYGYVGLCTPLFWKKMVTGRVPYNTRDSIRNAAAV